MSRISLLSIVTKNSNGEDNMKKNGDEIDRAVLLDLEEKGRLCAPLGVCFGGILAREAQNDAAIDRAGL